MTINTSTSLVKWKLTSPRRRVSNFDEPLYNRLWALPFRTETTIFHFVCRTEVNIAMEKSLHFRHREHNPWLGPRGCERESTSLQLVGAVPSIQYTASTVGLYIFSNTIPITKQQDCVSSSVEQLTGSQDSWSWQHNRLLSIGIGIWLMPPMAWAGEWSFGMSSEHGMVWLLSLAYVFCLLSVCFLFLWLSVWRTW